MRSNSANSSTILWLWNPWPAGGFGRVPDFPRDFALGSKFEQKDIITVLGHKSGGGCPQGTGRGMTKQEVFSTDWGNDLGGTDLNMVYRYGLEQYLDGMRAAYGIVAGSLAPDYSLRQEINRLKDELEKA